MRGGGIDVRHYVPGGREDGGGIGRFVGYIVDAPRPNAGSRHVVTDTRGPALVANLQPVRLGMARAGDDAGPASRCGTDCTISTSRGAAARCASWS